MEIKVGSEACGDTVSSLLVIIPCYNEEGSIESLLKEIHSLGKNYSTLVVDDGSTDSTFRIASHLSPTVRLVRNLGIGGAVQTGFKYALEKNYDYCVQIDGDGQHPPSEIAKLFEVMQHENCALVIGTRYKEISSFQSTLARRLGGRAIAWMLNRLFAHANITDPTSGMRLMNRDAIRLFAQTYPHDFPEPISLAWALGQGLKVRECSVHMRSRERGTSSIVGWKPLSYMMRVLGYIFLARISRRNRRRRHALQS